MLPAWNATPPRIAWRRRRKFPGATGRVENVLISHAKTFLWSCGAVWSSNALVHNCGYLWQPPNNIEEPLYTPYSIIFIDKVTNMFHVFPLTIFISSQGGSEVPSSKFMEDHLQTSR